MSSKAKRYRPTEKELKRLKIDRGQFLYIFLIPLFISIILALIKQEFSLFLFDIVAFGLFFLTAKLNIIALKSEYEYNTTTLIKAPKPLKILTATLLGISTLFTSYIAGGEEFFISLSLALVSIVGYFLYYGFDPKDDKLKNIGDISAEFVIETLATARGKLAEVEEGMKKIENKELYNKLRIAKDKGYEILNNIEKDPKDLRIARKFIIVYIDGLKKVTSSYINIEEKDIDNDTKERFSNLLSDVERRFDKEIIRLKENNKFDLDVQIDVLQEQIKN